jgi:hypothetical protein
MTDDLVQSWVYWQFKSYHDPTTQAMQVDGEVREGLYDTGTQFTCFTGTKAQILTQFVWLRDRSTD